MKNKLYYINTTRLGQLKNQILLVLHDYRGVQPPGNQCPLCHHLWSGPCEQCRRCGYRHTGFARDEGIRIEVTDWILKRIRPRVYENELETLTMGIANTIGAFQNIKPEQDLYGTQAAVFQREVADRIVANLRIIGRPHDQGKRRT